MGAQGGFDNSWTVDPVKLACVLRTADAAHLDERRAPGFLAAVRKPSGVSATHWRFQEQLYQPRLESDRLVYTSKSDFPIEEAASWWTCFDALQVLDHELRHVDSLLADTNRPRLAARGVSYADDPIRLAKLIGARDWVPVDARIKVGDVAKLVGSLGGAELYGRNDSVPLRELIQNGADAVRARRFLEGRNPNWGRVVVRTGEAGGERWVEVEDSGVGMSTEVLIGPFLDFGCSFWGTPLMHRELPGLESKGFASTGRFGIGFYSVFMWGDKIKVVTKRAERAHEETLVLEFQNGLTARPLLRRAEVAERMTEGGTKVRVWLKDAATFERILSRRMLTPSWTLEEYCAWLCPALDVDLYVEGKSTRPVVVASDWRSIRGQKLVRRLMGPIPKGVRMKFAAMLPYVEANLRLLKSASGEVVGRACVFPREMADLSRPHSPIHYGMPGAVTIGGLRASGLTGVSTLIASRKFTPPFPVSLKYHSVPPSLQPRFHPPVLAYQQSHRSGSSSALPEGRTCATSPCSK